MERSTIQYSVILFSFDIYDTTKDSFCCLLYSVGGGFVRTRMQLIWVYLSSAHRHHPHPLNQYMFLGGDDSDSAVESWCRLFSRGNKQTQKFEA